MTGVWTRPKLGLEMPMPLFRRVNDLSKRAALLAEAGMAPLAIFALAAVIVVSVFFWDETEDVRNVGLVVAAVIALPVAIWRSRVAEQQADTAHLDLLDGRFQHAVEMLGSSVPAIRVTGMNALRRLAAEYPDSYGDRVEELFDVLRQFPVEDEHDHD